MSKKRKRITTLKQAREYLHKMLSWEAFIRCHRNTGDAIKIMLDATKNHNKCIEEDK